MTFSEQFPIVVQALNTGFLQTLKLFFVTLLGAIPLGLIISFGTMSRFKPLSYFAKIIVWIVRGTPLMIQLLIIFYFHHFHSTNLQRQTEQCDKSVCVVMIVKISGSERSQRFIVQAVWRSSSCLDDIAFVQF